jgi:hypothetical protein
MKMNIVPFLGSGNGTLKRSWNFSMDTFITRMEYRACSIRSGVANTRIWCDKNVYMKFNGEAK